MMAPSPHEITMLLQAWGAGDKGALDKLMPLVYPDLHRLARRHMAGERDDHTLQTTALVNEAYMRLVDSRQATLKDRAHFFAICARLMRQILVDAARSRRALKRGADFRVVELDEAMAAMAEPAVDLIALDDALNALTAFDARKGQVVEMRIFGGLSAQETASVLQISTDTVTRDMHLATAWLRRELVREGGHGA
jgi:RNA polymerase sigma factor (TIGR02999 family)